MPHQLLGIGLTGKSLTDLERRILSETTPYAVVLFLRNVGSAEELRELVREVKAIAKRPPLMMIDEEGGRVDRLRHLIPGLPSAEAFGEGAEPAEMAAWGGRVIGMALRWFDIEVDLAPVVDIRGDAEPKGLERRTFGDDAETVVELAGAFMRGLHAGGTASCLKHFPGIGTSSADSHYGTAIVDSSLDEIIARDLVPFARLGNEAGAIMVGHGTYPQFAEEDLPATLSRRVATDLLRNETGFDGVAVSDDMEMHAVSDLGSYEMISERALLAGNDVVMFASHIERIPDVEAFLRRRKTESDEFRARYDQACRRADRYREHVNAIRAAAAPLPDSFEAIVQEAARFVEELTKTRPMREVVRTPGTGRTGREEWT
jgi:beta-N-acetylhexosaminidase